MWMIRGVGAVLLLTTLLPFWKTGLWFIRGWDFPRLQVAILLCVVVIAAAIAVFYVERKRELLVWLSLLSIAAVWQASHVLPFTPLWQSEVASTDRGDDHLQLLIVNLDFQNDSYAAVAEEIRNIDADVLVLIELDEDWQRGLTSLRASYPHAVGEVRGEGLGLAVWSRRPLRLPEIRFVIEPRRPSIWTEIQVGQSSVQLVAVHPTPPGLKDSTSDSRRDSRVRDAELVLIAKQIARRRGESWIVAGDFNDVAWSHTTRLFKRLSGLKDPRVGRSFMGTYHAQYPIVRFPIDHVFVSDGFTLGSLARHRITGSDHFGVSATFSLKQPHAGVTPDPEGDDRDEAEEMIDEGQEDAQGK